MSARNPLDTRHQRHNNNNFSSRRKTPSPTTMKSLRYSPKVDGTRGGKLDENNNTASPDSNRSSPSQQANIAYAGAKFSEPPHPAFLPRPPSHWTRRGDIVPPTRCDVVSSQLKMLLKVEVVA